MKVKWHGCQSVERSINGGCPAGATLGLLQFLSQSNDCATMVPEDDRFRYLDDLSLLEIIDLLMVGLSSYNFKQNVASNIPSHNQFIPKESLQSQVWLDQISEWTKKNEGKINSKKSKTMIFNYTNDYQFTTQFYLENEPLEVISTIKLLGTIISSDLSWNLNTDEIIKKANARLQLLRKVSGFGASDQDLKEIYILFVRSILEKSAVVWHSSITVENKDDLERVQKTALKIILGLRYKSYENALDILELETLEKRRDKLCLNFARKASKHPKCKNMFPLNEKMHKMKTRRPEKFKVLNANTERMKKSPLIFMQNLLNKNELRK